LVKIAILVLDGYVEACCATRPLVTTYNSFDITMQWHSAVPMNARDG
jgi:hypothetical protein